MEESAATPLLLRAPRWPVPSVEICTVVKAARVFVLSSASCCVDKAFTCTVESALSWAVKRLLNCSERIPLMAREFRATS
jgi:hypothetical protein